METMEIAGTGLEPSRIGLGTWAIGGWMWGGSGEQEAIETIHSAIDRGITLIDTAPVYGFGRSDRRQGTRRPRPPTASGSGDEVRPRLECR